MSRKEYQQAYFQANKDRLAAKRKQYYQDNKETILAQQKQWKIDYSEANGVTYHNQYDKVRKQIDPLFKLSKNIKSLIRETIKNNGFKKNSKSVDILGCSYEQFKQHLESMFEPWMNWNNYGNPNDKTITPNKTWDIDHIIPISSATNDKEIIELNHYTNLRPLCSYQNRWIKRDGY